MSFDDYFDDKLIHIGVFFYFLTFDWTMVPFGGQTGSGIVVVVDVVVVITVVVVVVTVVVVVVVVKSSGVRFGNKFIIMK